jgi:osmotically-inducible protein OsmY
MSILSRFTHARYNDDEIVHRAETAITEDPLISDWKDVDISSDKGVLTLSGFVHKETEKDRVEGVVRSSLRDAGLKFDRIVNELGVH